jgi:hypothetical protein
MPYYMLLVYQLSVCFLAAESVLPANSNLSKLFYDCKDYIIGIYQDEMSKEKLDEICKVLCYYLFIWHYVME